MKKTAIIIMSLALIGKLFGFVRELALSYMYGASPISDAYIISLTIPVTIFSMIGVGVSTVFIPVFNDIESKESTDNAYKFTNNLLGYCILISLALSLLIIIFAKQLVFIFASGFTAEVTKLATFWTRIGALGIVFASIRFIFEGLVQSKKKFHVPSLVTIPYSIVIIISILFSRFNSLLLPIGSVLAIIVQLLFFFPYFRKFNFRINLIGFKRDKNLIKLFLLSLPIIAGVSVNQMNILIDRTIASNIIEGGITALNYANRLTQMVIGIFVLSIVTMMFTSISKHVSNNDIEKVNPIFETTVNLIFLFVVPCTVGIIIFSEDIVTVLFKRGAFDLRDVKMTSECLVYYSFGMLGFSLREVVSRIFYAFQDTKTPMINATIGVMLNILLNIVLSKYMGLKGLALATAISSYITAILLAISLKQKNSVFKYKNIIVTFFKTLLSSLVMGWAAVFMLTYLKTFLGLAESLFISVFLAVIVYISVMFIMQVNELIALINRIMQKLRTS